MSAAKHLLVPLATTDQRERCRTICGESTRPSRVTEDPRAVTCKRCLDAIAARVAAKAAADARPFEPSGPYRPPRAQSALTALSVGVVQRSIGGDDETMKRFAWKSPALALQALASFDVDGTPLRSTSSPARFERLPMGRADATRAVTALPDRLLGARRAFDSAYLSALRLPASTDVEGRDRPALIIGVDVQRAVLWLSVAGGSAAKARAGRGNFSSLSHGGVANAIERVFGLDLTERQVALIRRRGMQRVAAHLRAIGELAPLERRAESKEDDVAFAGTDLEGWKDIAACVGRSVDWCRRASERDEDPLPLLSVSGDRGVYARREDVLAWAARQISPRSARG